MPFRSVAQLIYLKKHEPEVYEKWKAEHGTKIVPSKSKKSKAKTRKKAKKNN